MALRQQTNSGKKRPKCSLSCRIGAAAVFGIIAAGTAILWLSSRGYINLGLWVGVCGFKQRHGVPCPSCGWTHALEAFLNGHPIEAFMTQPAATFFYVAGILAGFYALLVAVFGINNGFLKRLIQKVGIKTLLACTIIIFLAGWIVTFVRAAV